MRQETDNTIDYYDNHAAELDGRYDGIYTIASQMHLPKKNYHSRQYLHCSENGRELSYIPLLSSPHFLSNSIVKGEKKIGQELFWGELRIIITADVRG